jgi:hypothetical protein
VHNDRASSAWLGRRFIDPEAQFEFVTGPDDLLEGAVACDFGAVGFGHYGQVAGVSGLVAVCALAELRVLHGFARH